MTFDPFPAGQHMPFSPPTGGQPLRVNPGDTLMVDNVTVFAVAIPTPLGTLPGLVLTFANSYSGPLQPLAYIDGDENELRRLPQLFADAIDAAIAGARDANVLADATEIVDDVAVLCTGCGRSLHGALRMRGTCLTCQPPGPDDGQGAP